MTIMPVFKLGHPMEPRGVAAFVFPVYAIGLRGATPLVAFPSAAERVEVRDSGAIDTLVMINQSGEPVLVRGGTLLEGMGTQSRSTVATVVLRPGVQTRVAVRCVNLAHPVVGGSKFRATGRVAPLSVARTLHEGDQMRTWVEVNKAIESTYVLPSREGQGDERVDLVSAAREHESQDDRVAFATAELSARPGQVGILSVGPSGFVGFEAFSVGRIWESHMSEILRSHVEASLNQSVATDDWGPMTSDEAAIVAEQVLASITRFQGTGRSRELIGAMTNWNNQFVHATFMPRDDTPLGARANSGVVGTPPHAGPNPGFADAPPRARPNPGVADVPPRVRPEFR